MKYDNKSFQERYEAWKNGADYWKDIRGVNLGGDTQEELSDEDAKELDKRVSDILTEYSNGKDGHTIKKSPQLLYWEYMMSKGVDPTVAAGIAGNIQLESTFNHKASNGTHWGLVLTDKVLTDYIKKAYGDFSLDSLMSFLSDIALGAPRKINHKGYNEVLSRSKSFRGLRYKDAADAANGWEIYFERSGGSAVGKRQKYAKLIYDKYNTISKIPTAAELAELNLNQSPIIINSPSTKSPETINAAVPRSLIGPVIDLNAEDARNLVNKKLYELITTPTLPNILNLLPLNNFGKDAYGQKFWWRRNNNLHFDEGKDPYLYKPNDYDFVLARDLEYKAGPDGHWPSRNYKTGRYLKSPVHPTLYKGIIADNSLGYYPYYRDGAIYTNTWKGNEPYTGMLENYIQYRYGKSKKKVTKTK